MWETARAKLREWYIVIIGVCLIAGGFFLASHQPSSTTPSSVAQIEKSPLADSAGAATSCPYQASSHIDEGRASTFVRSACCDRLGARCSIFPATRP